MANNTKNGKILTIETAGLFKDGPQVDIQRRVLFSLLKVITKRHGHDQGSLISIYSAYLKAMKRSLHYYLCIYGFAW